MTQSDKIIRSKMSLLDLAEYLQNVSEACKVMGVSRQHFYDIKQAYNEGGAEAEAVAEADIGLGEAGGGDVFGKIPEGDVKTLAPGCFDAFGCQKTDLTVPFPGMRIPLDAMILC